MLGLEGRRRGAIFIERRSRDNSYNKSGENVGTEVTKHLKAMMRNPGDVKLERLDLDHLEKDISVSGNYTGDWLHHPEWSNSTMQIYEGLHHGEGDVVKIIRMRDAAKTRERIKHYYEISQAYGDADQKLHEHMFNEKEADADERKENDKAFKEELHKVLKEAEDNDDKFLDKD